MGNDFFPVGPPNIFDSIGIAVLQLVEQIIQFLKALVDWIWKNLLGLLSDIVYVFQILGKVLYQAVLFIWNGIQKVEGFFKKLWTGFLKNIVAKVFTLTRKVQLWLEQKLAPLIKFLKTARKY